MEFSKIGVKPTAILLFPVVLLCNAPDTNALLFDPVVFNLKENRLWMGITIGLFQQKLFPSSIKTFSFTPEEILRNSVQKEISSVYRYKDRFYVGRYARQSGLTILDTCTMGPVANYLKSAAYPKGETQLDFQLGEFEFNALNFDYLVISGAKAQFKGTGKITGDQGGYAFIMAVIDGQLDGSGTDKVRMKIFNKNTGDVIYDNQPGAGDVDDPVMPVGENSIVTISTNSTKNKITNTASVAMNNKTNSTAPEVNLASPELEMNAYPNPTSSWFNLKVQSPNHKDRIVWQVTDLNGKVIETRTIVPGQNITIGQTYRPGAYFVRIVQGKEQKQAKLIKLN